MLNFNCKCESISSFEIVPEYFLVTLGKIQLLENHLPRDDKLTLNQSPSGLSIGVEMLTPEVDLAPEVDLPAVKYYHKVLHLGCPRSASEHRNAKY